MDSLTTAALKLYWCIWLLRLFEVKASEWKSCHYNSTTVSSYQLFYLFIYLFIYYCYYSARCFYRLEIGWVLLIELEDGLEQLSEDFEVVQEGFFEILVGMLFYWSTGRSSRSNVPLRRRWDADGTPMLSWSSRLAHYYYFHITCWFSFVCLTVEPPPPPPPPPPLPPPPLPLTSMALVTPDRNPCPIWGTFHPWRSGWITLLLQFRILFEGCSKILGTNQCLQPRLNETKSLNSWSEIHQGPVWTTEAVDWRRRRLKRCDWCADQRQGFSAVLAFIAANLFGLKIGNSTEEVVYE